MTKLTKSQLKQHNAAADLLKLEHLSEEDKCFILDNWHEATVTNPTESGAFFTPFGLARDFAIDAGANGRVLDVCAGIGTLSLACKYHTCMYRNKPEFTCIEINPTFVEIGKRILPEATWICADVADLPNLQLGKFDTVISNPPFGTASRCGHQLQAPRYRGAEFEFKIIDALADVADYGAFILPQQSCPFRYSGQRCHYQDQSNRKLQAFMKDTGIELEAGCGVDTHLYRDQWKSTNIVTEIVTVDFQEWRRLQTVTRLNSSLPDLFANQNVL